MTGYMNPLLDREGKPSYRCPGCAVMCAWDRLKCGDCGSTHLPMPQANENKRDTPFKLRNREEGT